jgi:hypothetical protein
VTYAVNLEPVDTCTGEALGRYGYLDVSAIAIGALDTPPELLAGQTLTLRLEATDFAGTTASDEVEVVAVPDPDDVD